MKRSQRIVLISIYCSLAIVLDYIKTFLPFLNMPFGGSINIALIPITVCSFHLGAIHGVTCGLLWWLISSLLGLNPYYVSITQYILDYILPSASIGLCSIFYKKKKIYEVEIGIIFSMMIRTFLLVVSGAIFWPSDVAANTKEAWIASLSYNVPYCFMTMIILLIIIPIIIRSIRKYML